MQEIKRKGNEGMRNGSESVRIEPKLKLLKAMQPSNPFDLDASMKPFLQHEGIVGRNLGKVLQRNL